MLQLIDLTMGVHKPHHHIRLTWETKLDLGVWLEFLLYSMAGPSSWTTVFLLSPAIQGCSRWNREWGTVCGRVVLW